MKVLPLGLVLASSYLATFVHAESEFELKILEELRALNANVDRLEARVLELESRLEPDRSMLADQSAGNIEQNNSMIDRVVDAVWVREESINYPWLDSTKWGAIEIGMSSEEVLQILGKPTTDEPSLNRRVDVVYTYRGRRSGTGEKVTGKVRFFHDEVVSIEVP